jgi:hypothetical protein
MSIIGSNILAGASGQAGGGGAYEIQRSLRFNAPNSSFLSRTPGTAGNRKTWTWAGWVKRSELGNDRRFFEAGTAYNDALWIGFGANNRLSLEDYTSGAYQIQLISDSLYRDPSAWYHIVIAVDTTQATNSNRIKLYVNTIQIANFNTSTYPSQNYDTRANNTVLHTTGGSAVIGGSAYFNGYLADIHFIDGQALDPTSFGEFDTNNVWQPKSYSGSYGTNGFHLPFSDNSTAAALGTDTSGNGNTWTVNNLSVTAGAGNDSLRDSPTNGSQTDTGVGGEVVGNYATLNPLDGNPSLGWTNGNLDVPAPSNAWRTGSSTIGVTSGKWYWEVLHTGTPGGNQGVVGIVKSGYGSGQLGGDNSGFGYYTSGEKTGTGTNFAYGAAWTTNDVIGVAFDADNGTLTFYKNNASQGVAWTGITGGPWMPAVSVYAISLSYNFGQRPFAYTAPSGFKALCTTNLPEPTIADGSTVMDVALYTGNGSTQTISGLNFSPDLVWIKARSAADWHLLTDTVRGTTVSLASNATNAELNFGTQGLSAFNSDGFSVGNEAGFNRNGTTYVGWTWDAGTTTASNPDGSITSQVRANASAGFSVVTWTGNGSAGATIGHSLGIAPRFVIFKARSISENWNCYHGSLGASQLIGLNLTGAASATNDFNNTAPSSTLITLGSGSGNNGSGTTYVAYAFAPVSGYSSFGSYVGNGSSDGVFVYTGFRVKWYLVKQSSASGENWRIIDATRSPYNVAQDRLLANSSAAEGAQPNEVDFLSNGFKFRSADGAYNGSGATYIYCAFAESPFQYARAR